MNIEALEPVSLDGRAVTSVDLEERAWQRPLVTIRQTLVPEAHCRNGVLLVDSATLVEQDHRYWVGELGRAGY